MTALYRFYDADGQLLYVGITDRGPRRWREHMADKPWWPDVARVELEHYPSREAALAAETAAIITEQPQHNIAGTAGQRTSTIGRPRQSHVCPANRRRPFGEWLSRSHPDVARWAHGWALDLGWSSIVSAHRRDGRIDVLADAYWEWISQVYTDDEWGLGMPQTDACPRCPDYCSHLPERRPAPCTANDPFVFQCNRCGHTWTCWFGTPCYDPGAVDFWRWHNAADLCPTEEFVAS